MTAMCEQGLAEGAGIVALVSNPRSTGLGPHYQPCQPSVKALTVQAPRARTAMLEQVLNGGTGHNAWFPFSMTRDARMNLLEQNWDHDLAFQWACCSGQGRSTPKYGIRSSRSVRLQGMQVHNLPQDVCLNAHAMASLLHL